ncbi:MAG: hypothetical protein F4Y14_08795 [Acidobacteria bacterium]|nr:hypothetical protein [Acidobacteriota bacterium]
MPFERPSFVDRRRLQRLRQPEEQNQRHQEADAVDDEQEAQNGRAQGRMERGGERDELGGLVHHQAEQDNGPEGGERERDPGPPFPHGSSLGPWT